MQQLILLHPFPSQQIPGGERVVFYQSIAIQTTLSKGGAAIQINERVTYGVNGVLLIFCPHLFKWDFLNSI